MEIISSINKDDAYYPYRDSLIGLEIHDYDLFPSTCRKGKWLAGRITTTKRVRIQEMPNNPKTILTKDFYFYAVKVEEK